MNAGNTKLSSIYTGLLFAGVLLLTGNPFLTFGQEEQLLEDTVKIRNHSPRTAIVLSALIPGLGQIYNGKIWKVPLIYGGAGAAINAYNFYQLRYKKVLSYLKDIDTQSQERYEIYGKDISGYNLANARDYYRRKRDYSMLFIGGVYLLNVIDALVDAHFFNYDISDDLSLNIQPVYLQPGLHGSAGMQLCFKF